MTVSKVDKVNGVEYTYDAEWIYELETEEHWRLYWSQQKLMDPYLNEGDSVLEIGVGSGFTANYLKSKGYDVTTIDIDEEKNADITANIVTYDFEKTYDYISAFEVLEHIPFEEAKQVVKKVSEKCRKGFFLSVPQSEWILFRGDFKIPLIGRKHIEITFPRRRILETNHFWEIGKYNISLQQLDDIFSSNGFLLKERFKRFSRYFMFFMRE